MCPLRAAGGEAIPPDIDGWYIKKLLYLVLTPMLWGISEVSQELLIISFVKAFINPVTIDVHRKYSSSPETV